MKWKLSDKTKEKMRKSHIGKKPSLGKHWKLSKETKKKMSEAHKNKKPYEMTDEIKKHMSQAKKGKVLSEEHKNKIGLSHKGKKHKPMSEQGKRNISEAHKGYIMSQSQKDKISKANKGKCIGNKRWNWKGGITPENDKIRKSIEYRLWRESVFARDGWVCQKCKKKGYKLHPHHIKNFAEVKELRFAIDNGITLCSSCHKLFHKLYGQRNNNLEQLNEFLEDVKKIFNN